MKKFLLIAVAAFGMLMTACSKDEVTQPVGGEESIVTFTVEAPVMQTRAEHGDGKTATELNWAAYDHNAAINSKPLITGSKNFDQNKLTTTVEIPFVNGMTYDILFWAESENSPYEVNWDAKTVGYDSNVELVSNSMDYDAFYYFLTGDELGVIEGLVTKTVELKRPFAQLNIATNDTEDADDSGLVVENVAVEVTNAYTQFSLVSGNGVDNTNTGVTFTSAPKQGGKILTDYDLLAVNYLFTGGEKQLVNVKFTYTDGDTTKGGDAGRTVEYNSVPVQRNYRTNIVGSLLTSDGKFNIEIKPGFDGTNDHSVATATPEDVNALIQNPEVTTVELGAGVYNIDLYDLNEKRTLTINGTEGTKIEFKNLQVRASQFDELVINNCEILRMPDKFWGHLVFGSSDNAQGVYTISNCTFNGDGTQGIFINENTSGATYNILNCTFNGDFGNEGAITIQRNNGVDFTINVLGCTFNNIPSTSHNIWANHNNYWEFTLNTDLKATTIDEVNSLINCGAKTINLADGNYNLSNLKILPTKAITLVGENKDNCVVTIASQLRQEGDGKSLTLKNLTVDITEGLNYGEHTFAWIHFFKEFNMVDCKSNGRIRLNCYSANIDNCEFNVTTSSGFDGYAIHYQGATNSKVVVSNSTFNTVGKAIVLYNEGTPVLDMTVNNCTFLSSQTTDKAAIQMHTELGISGKLTINNSTATGFAAINNGLYNELNNQTKKPTHNFNITVDGKVASTKALEAALAAGETNIELMPATYDAGQFQVVNKTLSLKGIGDGAKIFISQNNDVAYTSFDSCNVTFENLTIETLGGIYKGFARMEGTYKNCTFVNNYFTLYGKHEFIGCTFNAPALTGSNKNEHCMWTYGAEEVDFVNCVFNYSDRGVNVYVDNGANAPGIKSDVAFTNCVFNTTNASSEGAVEINSSPFTAGVTVALNGCTAPAYGEMVYISRWDSTNGRTATVTVQ